MQLPAQACCASLCDSPGCSIKAAVGFTHPQSQAQASCFNCKPWWCRQGQSGLTEHSLSEQRLHQALPRLHTSNITSGLQARAFSPPHRAASLDTCLAGQCRCPH